MTEQHRCWAEIDRAALRHNAKVARERIGQAELLAVVKANGYGHGMIGVAEALADDAQLFGVANLEEALALREKLPHPIIILGPALPNERSTIVERGFIPTISAFEEARAFSQIAQSNPHRLAHASPPLPGQGEARVREHGGEGRVLINYKLDTGMGRMGVIESEAVEVFKRVAALAKIDIHSVSTHLPVANEEEEYTRKQLARFRNLVDQMRATVPGNYKAHILQSSGTLAFNEAPHEIVRAGTMLYGISPLPEFQTLLKPAMTWKTRVGLVRDLPKGASISYGRTFIAPKPMRVATLTAGYADGYPRHLSNAGAQMLLRGQRCDLLGRVTMDLMVIDVSHIDDVDPGEEVVLMGRQGSEEVSCAELAEKANTITWEITTRIAPRVRRVFV